MSRPILSRPRTRVYGCNYDKGESYYKPMVDHLDRKYSGRPLFSEPRNSLADEIAASRNDIGSRDLGPRSNPLSRDLDLELDPLIRNPQLPLSSSDSLFPENEEIVYDSRGQRSRRRLAENFVNDVTATTQHLKAKLATIGIDEEVDAALGKPSRRLRQDQDLLENGLFAKRDLKSEMRSAIEDAEANFKRRSKILEDIDLAADAKPVLLKWSKLNNEEDSLASAAATRAKQTKARLNDLESEMEELSERQAKRERRAAALRAMINETAAENESLQEQQSSSILTQQVLAVTQSHHSSAKGSRDIGGNRNGFYDGVDYTYDRGYDDDFENEFVVSQRRHKERAAAAFLDDLADIRRKRRDMQDRIFDVIDLNAEIEKAKTTLEAADIAFQKHANKFDNTENCEDAPEKRTPKTIKFIKVPNVDIETCVPFSRKSKQERQNNALPEPESIEDPLKKLALLPIKRRFLKRKKSVSF